MRRFLISDSHLFEVKEGGSDANQPMVVEKPKRRLTSEVLGAVSRREMSEVWKTLPSEMMPVILDEMITKTIWIGMYERAAQLICVNRDTLCRWAKWFYADWNGDREEVVSWLGDLTDAFLWMRSLSDALRETVWGMDEMPLIVFTVDKGWRGVGCSTWRLGRGGKYTMVEFGLGTKYVEGMDWLFVEVSGLGGRPCDAYVLEGRYRKGVFEAKQVIDAGAFVMLVDEEGELVSDWDEERWQWEKVAEWVFMSLERTELYLAQEKTVKTGHGWREDKTGTVMVKVLS